MSLISAVDAAKCMEPPDRIATGQHVVPVILDHTDILMTKGNIYLLRKTLLRSGLHGRCLRHYRLCMLVLPVSAS